MKNHKYLIAPRLCLVGLASLMCAPSLRGESDESPPPQVGPVADQDASMLTPPEKIEGVREFVVARKAPRLTFSSIRGLPLRTKETGGLWCSWGEGICASNGQFYAGVGDHRGFNGNCYLYEYDPATHQHRQVMDVAEVVGQRPGDWGHGKLHGRLDQLADGWIYMGTYWGEDARHLGPDKVSRLGGRLLRYHPHTGDAEDLGMPLLGDSFPMHATDARRGIFHAIGWYGHYLAYDLHERRPVYAGRLPGDLTWHYRATMVDPKTGKCYASEFNTRRIVEYDPNRNAFRHTRATVPVHPVMGDNARHWIRSYTPRRLADGSFIVQTYDGVMFKFFPDTEQVEFIALNWGNGLYSTSMALSPGDKYLYFAVGAHGQTWEFGSPLIQFDTETHTTKVIAFLHPYYQNKYGYVFGGSYSVCLDASGANLLVTWNGRFRSTEETGESFGHPSFLYVEIPPEERPEPPPTY